MPAVGKSPDTSPLCFGADGFVWGARARAGLVIPAVGIVSALCLYVCSCLSSARVTNDAFPDVPLAQVRHPRVQEILRTCSGSDYLANRKFGPELTRIVYHADYHTIFGRVVIADIGGRPDDRRRGVPLADAAAGADVGTGWELSSSRNSSRSRKPGITKGSVHVAGCCIRLSTFASPCVFSGADHPTAKSAK